MNEYIAALIMIMTFAGLFYMVYAIYKKTISIKL